MKNKKILICAMIIFLVGMSFASPLTSILNVGDSFELMGYKLLLQNIVYEKGNGIAIFDLYSSDEIINQVKLREGESQTLKLGNFEYILRLESTAPSYTYGAKWAKIVSYSTQIYQTSSVNLIAISQVTPQGYSNEGVLFHIIDYSDEKILASVVTGKNGASAELPLDTKFYVITKDSKDDFDYSNDKAIYYLSVEDGIVKLCNFSGCDYNLEITLKASPKVLNVHYEEKNAQYGYMFQLNKGWNLVSVPLYQGKLSQTTCANKKAFVYDSSVNQYNSLDLTSDYVTYGNAFWIKSTESCDLSFNGKSVYDMDSVHLGKGWNLIGAPTGSVYWNDVKGSCDLLSGPWYYNTKENKWERSKFLYSGVGFAVKIAQDCNLGDGGIPALPNEKSESVSKEETKSTETTKEEEKSKEFKNTIDAMVDDDPFIGSSSADIIMVEFSDFECPFCKKFHDETYQTLKTNYIDTGKVQFVYRDFPLSAIHPNAQKAAEASECAHEQGKFWEYHNKLFENQNALLVSNLKQYALDVELDADKFNECLNSAYYSKEVKKDFEDASANGAMGTPAFYIGKRGGEAKQLNGALPYSSFKDVIEGLLQ